MAPPPRQTLDFGAFHHPPSPLFRAHLSGDERARSFYGAGWTLDDIAAAATRATRHPRPAAEVAEALARQQLERGAEQAAVRARQLQSGAAAIVTGQQPVLFGGPLFVIYKALGALLAAEELERRTGQPVVPVFWVAADDHDFAEIREVTVVDASGALRSLRYVPRQEPASRPASSIVLDDSIVDLLGELRSSLPAGLARDAVLDVVAGCYQPGLSISDAFARLLSALFPTLVVLDPSDPRLKAAMAPLLARELAEASPTSRWATEDGARLLAAGFHQQVPVREGFFNLFLLWEGERRALGVVDGGLEVRGAGHRMGVEQALDLLRRAPARFSPGVLLRPLAQDHLLPTAAYVGGPAEVAYLAQIGSSYPGFGIPRPVIMPRPSVTLVEPAQARALEAEGLSLTDLQYDPEQVLGRWARESYPDVEDAFARLRADVERGLGDLGDRLGRLDPTLRGAAEGAVGRVLHQVDGLHEKSLRALKKKEQSRADRLRRTRDALMPGGSLQERGISVVNLLARQGLPVLDVLRAAVDPWSRGHQVIQL